MVEAVVFDLYETLITELDPNWKPGPSLAERLGIDEQVCLREWYARSRDRYTGGIPNFPAVLHEICKATGKPVNDSMIQALYQERLRIKAMPFDRVEREILLALQQVRTLGLKIGLITNCASEDVAAWSSSKLAAFFDDVIFSCEVGLCKPDPEVYLLSCSGLKVPPSRCLFIGDGGSDELAGAVRVGMRSYWATWFLDRWPPGVRRENVESMSNAFPRLKTFGDLVHTVTSLVTSGDER